MIKNNIKVAFRTFGKNKVYSFINILGLTIGLTACMLVATVVIDDLSYDKFWKRSDDLYKVNMYNPLADGLNKQSSSPLGLGAALMEQFPELENYAAINTSESQLRIKEGDQNPVSVRAIDGDSTLLDLLDFQMLSSGKLSFVAGQENIIITESFRDTYFKGEDPVGKFMFDVQHNTPFYFISAVIKDIPQNTHLRAQAIVLRKPSTSSLHKKGYGGYRNTYFLLKPATDRDAFTQKVNQWYAEYMDLDDKAVSTFEFQSIKDVYLNSDFDERLNVKSTIQTVYIFGGIGALLLLIACINFVNLSTARVMKRLKEMGVRKVLGAGRQQLMVQFLTESLLFFGLSIILAYVLYSLSIPPIQSFLGHELANTLVSEWSVILITVIGVFTLSIIVGLYPAWLMSGFKPVISLKGKLSNTTVFAPTWVRQMLVVVQFTIAIVVLVALLVVNKQLEFLNEKDLGYNKEDLLYISRQVWDGKEEAFKTELKKISGVEAVSISEWNPQLGIGTMKSSFDHPLKEGEKLTADFIIADFDFPQTIGMKIQKGRFLDPQYGNDSYSIDSTMRMAKEVYEAYRDSRSVITTNSTAKMLGIDSLGNIIRNVGFRTVGIVADFHNKSLHQALEPVFILAQKETETGSMFIRIKPGSEKETIPAISELSHRFYPNKILDVNWVSDILAQQYEAEQKQRSLFVFFSNLMLFVSALGVFGLIIHAAEQRVKEIGIRKVLGASVAGIVRMLSSDFVKLVFIAVLIASPIAWWTMNKWLQDFAYRVDIEWWMFVLAGMLAVVIALLTVSFQAVKAAVAKPVDSLRDE